MKQKTIIEHMEQYLGPIRRGWTQAPNGSETGFQVVECTQGQIEDARAFSTLGLSNHLLSPGGLGDPIRQELLIVVRESFGSRNIPAVLQQLALAALRHHSAYLRGEVIERPNRIFPDRALCAFYATIPTILPDEFATYADPHGHEIIFAWMVPITEAEVEFVREKGWSQFEDLLIGRNVDLVDLDRMSAV